MGPLTVPPAAIGVRIRWTFGVGVLLIDQVCGVDTVRRFHRCPVDVEWEITVNVGDVESQSELCCCRWAGKFRRIPDDAMGCGGVLATDVQLQELLVFGEEPFGQFCTSSAEGNLAVDRHLG